MIHGIYLSSQGANVQSFRQDVIANNLANATTTGFKRDVVTFKMLSPSDYRRDLPSQMDGNRQLQAGALQIDKITTNHRSGALLQTGRPLDIGISGYGFLRVTDGQNEYLTRNGQLRRSTNGELVTENQGLKVLDTNGSPIEIPEGSRDITIAEDGLISVLTADEQLTEVARIDLVSAPADQLRKVGNSLYRTDAEIEKADASVRIRQSFTEASGVSPVTEMTAMIETSRAFEANINMIKIQDESLGRLLQTLGG